MIEEMMLGVSYCLATDGVMSLGLLDSQGPKEQKEL